MLVNNVNYMCLVIINTSLLIMYYYYYVFCRVGAALHNLGQFYHVEKKLDGAYACYEVYTHTYSYNFIKLLNYHGMGSKVAKYTNTDMCKCFLVDH